MYTPPIPLLFVASLCCGPCTAGAAGPSGPPGAFGAPKTPTLVSAGLGQEPPVLQIRNLRTGQVLCPGTRPAMPPPVPRDPAFVFDSLSSPNSSAMLNIAYVNPGSYDGSDPRVDAWVLPMGERTAFPNYDMAYRDPANGIPIPTDIVWNDYTADPALWPGGAGTINGLRQVDLVLFLRNNFAIPPHTTPQPRTDTLRVLFFSADGLVYHDGFEVMHATPAGYNQYFLASFDLSQFNPPLRAPDHGLIMLDWLPTNNVGVGTMLAGGDFSTPGFPQPESLITVGSTDPMFWEFADGLSGNAAHPSGVDPGYDGDAASISYLDILNTGALTNWQVGGTAFVLTHDFPCRISVMTLGVPTGACTVQHPFACFITTQADCAAQSGTYLGDNQPCPPTPMGACQVNSPAPSCSQMTEADCLLVGGLYLGDGVPCPGACPCDVNSSGSLNSQDFFDFIVCFFGGACPSGRADFNLNGVVDSQDFFDFLTCFFSPPGGC